jgi:type VI secretion system protein
MNLSLKIVKAPEGSNLTGKSIDVDVHGLSIGRADNNDLVLPGDASVSKQHAVIQYQQGNFYIYDISTNGVYIAGSMQPLNASENNHQMLVDQDTLRMGGYTLVAHLAQSYGQPKPEVDLDSLFNQSGNRRPLLEEERTSQADENLSETEFDLDSFLRGETPASTRPTIQPAAYNEPLPEMATRVSPPVKETLSRDLEAMFEQLGLSEFKIDSEKQREVLEQLATIIRTTLQCMLDSLHKRQDSLQNLGLVSIGYKKTRNNPLLFSANAEEALKKLLFPPRGEVYLSAEEAIPECFADLENYQYYLAMAAKDTLRQTLEKFSPKEVAELLCDVEVKRKLFGGKALVNFDDYTEYYKKINEQAEGQLNRMLQQNFQALTKE